VILPNLLIGEYPTPNDAAWLAGVHQVTAVVSLQDDADLASKGLDLAELAGAYAEHGLGFHRVPLPDADTGIVPHRLETILVLLHQLLGDDERVYLHCNAGLNRAPTVAIAYLHAHYGLSLTDARDLVKGRRHCVPYMRMLEQCFRVDRE